MVTFTQLGFVPLNDACIQCSTSAASNGTCVSACGAGEFSYNDGCFVVCPSGLVTDYVGYTCAAASITDCTS